MARNFRTSRFNSNRDISEDVNPSAYIVNLADCMLVLACGFMVAMISFWQIDIGPRAEKLDTERLQEVEAEEMPEDIVEGGSYYVEAGTVYQDPSTGQYYIVAPTDEEASSGLGGAQSASGAEGKTGSLSNEVADSPRAGETGQLQKANESAGKLSDEEIRQQRSLGGD